MFFLYPRRIKAFNFDNFDNSHNSFIDFLCERWISCQAMTSVLCLHYRPETVHCSTKNAYNSEITFLTLHPWVQLRQVWREILFVMIFASQSVTGDTKRLRWNTCSERGILCKGEYWEATNFPNFLPIPPPPPNKFQIRTWYEMNEFTL